MDACFCSEGVRFLGPIPGAQRQGPKRNKSQFLAERGIEPERPPYSVREDGSLIALVRDSDRT